MDNKKAIKLIWEYMKLNMKLKKADIILIFGSHDIEVAKRGAYLYQQQYAPLIIVSGAFGRVTNLIWKKTEAEIFKNILIENKVPEDKIILENKATNTGENILFSQKLCKDKNIHTNKIICVNKPYMERRVYSAMKKMWNDLNEIYVTSPEMEFEEYCQSIEKQGFTSDDIINIMVGDVQRIELYAQKGFQIYQNIPTSVNEAFYHLVSQGYNKHLIK